MALETLKGADVGNFIDVCHTSNKITFQIQNGPIKEAGVNGCQVDDMIGVAATIISGLNQKFPCRENALTLTKLEEALHWMAARRVNREARGVEGQSKV